MSSSSQQTLTGSDTDSRSSHQVASYSYQITPLAQWIEHRTFNPKILGSIPRWGSIFFSFFLNGKLDCRTSIFEDVIRNILEPLAAVAFSYNSTSVLPRAMRPVTEDTVLKCCLLLQLTSKQENTIRMATLTGSLLSSLLLLLIQKHSSQLVLPPLLHSPH